MQSFCVINLFKRAIIVYTLNILYKKKARKKILKTQRTFQLPNMGSLHYDTS